MSAILREGTRIAAGADLRSAVEGAACGGVLLLEPGSYDAGFALTRSITLCCADETGDVVLRPGPDRGAVLWLDADDLTVALIGLRLTAGSAEVGGGISLRGFSQLTLERCTIDACRANQGTGDAVWADAGGLHLKACTLTGDASSRGAVLAVTGVADLTVTGCTLTGYGNEVVRLRDGCEAEITGSTLKNHGDGAGLSVAGTRGRRPVVTVQACRVAGTPSLALKAAYAGKVSVGDTVLASAASGVYRPLGDVVIRDF